MNNPKIIVAYIVLVFWRDSSQRDNERSYITVGSEKGSDKAAPENTPKALGRWRCPAMEGLEITFDEDNRIRVMPKEKFKQTEDLEAECNGFAEKIQAFTGTVDMLVEVLDGEALKIEEEKLRAIGQRNRAEMEAEARRRKQLSMEAAIKEKTQELERLTFQLNSLEKVEREQQALIEKLSNNETS